MKREHKFILGDSRIKILPSNSIDLVVTSPPYPMISMWDDIFKSMNKKIDINKDYQKAFNLMNKELAKVYKQVFRSLKNGGFFIINIGDATRSFNGNDFQLFPNEARTIEICRKIGFKILPRIYWSKPSNSPNRFLGSGMYPVSAYVTLENEHILIFRKGEKRIFSDEETKKRKKSAFFQSERNLWFTDIWKDINGTKQKVVGLSRKRNGAFPISLAYRIINMYSIEDDLVWDPFVGTGTTAIASILAGRNSINTDIEKTFINYSIKRIVKLQVDEMNAIIQKRIKSAKTNIQKKINQNQKKLKYRNHHYKIDVYTSQEQEIILPKISKINVDIKTKKIVVDYSS